MGEVSASSGQDMELELGVKMKNKDHEEGSVSSVRWDRFLPRMVVRVLLVESDDSTRRIISALLRKCSYRVAAVSDGLEAWEVLKGNSDNIDLILTESDLPSISGYALLTLVSEHESCKNIPVIMMSSQDSFRMVYKCMLRGAADYLVKPVRINELKTLWQHVWRRQSQLVTSGLGPKTGTLPTQKVEATAENNAASFPSTGSKGCSQRQEDMVKKGSDAQSSCTKADMEAESANMEEIKNVPRKIPVHDRDDYTSFYKKSSKRGAVTPDVQTGDPELEGHRELPHHHRSKACKNTNAVGNSSREATNLIGAFANNSNGDLGPSPLKNAPCPYDPSSQLHLSLRRFHVSGSDNNANEKHILNHSDTSAFSRYIYKPMHPTCPAAVSLCNPTEGKANIGDHLSDEVKGGNSDAKDAESSHLGTKQLFTPVVPKERVEATFSCSQQRLFPGPPSVQTSSGLDTLSTGYGPIAPSTSSTLQTPRRSGQQESSVAMNSFCQLNNNTISSGNNHYWHDQTANMPIDHTLGGQAQKMDCMEKQTHISSPSDQSGSNSLPNAGASHPNRSGSMSESNANTNSASAQMVVAESVIEESFISGATNSRWSSQREAALAKFRLKRKERCFEKKVRYESRKKLAEQRPRVKGQFVRHVQPDSPAAISETSGVNSSGSQLAVEFLVV